MIIGNKDTLAFDIKDTPSLDTPSLFTTLNIVINNKYICNKDNAVYIPQFYTSLLYNIDTINQTDWNRHQNYFEGKTIGEIHQFIIGTVTEGAPEYNIDNHDIYEAYRFLDWGPTTAYIACLIIPFENEFHLRYYYWDSEKKFPPKNGIIHNVQIDLKEILKTMNDTIIELKKKHNQFIKHIHGGSDKHCV